MTPVDALTTTHLMDYALAKALKDAGFFQEGRGTRVPPPDKIVARRDDYAYVPTLEELIAALPEEHVVLTRYKRNQWVAVNGGHETYNDAPGNTAIEAVARLWLELSK